jgi:hypothetical protein
VNVDRDRIIRRALGAAAFFNLGGALLFAFPSSPMGELAGLPVPVPRVYSLLLALFALLFGVLYAWLARQPRIERPLVALSAIGKATAFFIAFVCWLLGDLSGRTVLAISGDLLFAGLFAWWLVGEPAEVPSPIGREPVR